MSPYCMIITTLPDEQSARVMIDLLFEQKLVACIQMNPIQSFYPWNGVLCEEKEYRLLIKTRSACFEAIQTRIVEHHPYDVPEIIQIPITQGLYAYLDWIDAETNPFHVNDM